MEMSELKSRITRYALDDLGFDDCRFTGPQVCDQLAMMRRWLASGRHGDMDYLERHLPFKEDPGQLLPGVRTAMVVIKSYKNTPHKQLGERYKIARYAAGRDYHIVMRQRLERLADFIGREDPQACCYWGVDSRPIAERTLAVKAGIGFVGKNSMVIKPGLGSYFFIGVVLTTASLEPDVPLKWDCGACQLCLDACPTGALDTPYKVDARQCISYQTIEQKAPMSPQQVENGQGWIFGCDICQEVCPYNHGRVSLTDWPEFRPESGPGFAVFEGQELLPIPKDSALYRSRKRLRANWQAAKASPEKGVPGPIRC